LIFIFKTLVSPIPSLLEPLHDINRRNQNRHFNQRPHGTCQRLSTADSINSHDNRDSQFEIVARSREALRARDFIPEPKAAAKNDRDGEDDGEVHDQRSTDAQHGRNLRDDVLALGSEEHDDGEDEADQRPRRNEADEVQLIVAFPEEAAQG